MATPPPPILKPVVFCEDTLQYVSGFKAWIFLGPYLAGAFVLEAEVLDLTRRGETMVSVGGAGLLAYLVLHPMIWRLTRNFKAKYLTPKAKQCCCGST